MQVLLRDKVIGIARRMKRFLRNQKNALIRKLGDQENDLKRRDARSKKRESKQVRRQTKSKRREAKRISKDIRTAENIAKRREHRERKKSAQQVIFQLERGLGADRGQPKVAGSLPDFVVIGEKKCGTTYLYDLLAQHPLVEPAASKELHFFDNHFDLGVEWYRRCFPQPRVKDGQRTVTGEATPYMSHYRAPERMAEVVPEARLIALLRNPVDRTYSDYQQKVKKGREPQTLEAAIRAAEKRRSFRREGTADPEREHGANASIGRRQWYLSRSVYIDQLLRWREFFPKEQLLVLKSEDFFESPIETLQTVLEYLGLPQWQPAEEHLEGGKRNEGGYEEEMDPSTRRRLEEYFEPHNMRLYDYLGTDFGW